MVVASARQDRLLLEHPQARRRLARVEDGGARAVHRLDEARGESGDARQPGQEVERHALAAQDRGGGAGHLGHQAPLPPLALPSARVPAELRINATEDRLRYPQPRDHAGRLLLDARPRPRVRRDERLAGDVARPDVLGERAVDQLLHATPRRPRTGATRRGRP